MARHLSYSGIPVPSIIPGISLNWRRTYSTISIAALPTAFMAKAIITYAIVVNGETVVKTETFKGVKTDVKTKIKAFEA